MGGEGAGAARRPQKEDGADGAGGKNGDDVRPRLAPKKKEPIRESFALKLQRPLYKKTNNPLIAAPKQQRAMAHENKNPTNKASGRGSAPPRCSNVAPCPLPLLLAVLPLLLLLLLAPARAQTASAGSYASAAPGSSSSVTSGATATEPGSSATVVAVGVAPSGSERVVVDCRLAAAHASEQLARYCEGVPVPVGSGGSSSSVESGSSSSNNSADEEDARWRSAPACGKEAARGAKVVALDGAGRAWSREPDDPSGRLCAFREELGTGGQSLPGQPRQPRPPPQGPEDEWASAPACLGDPAGGGFLTRDRAGRAWGWENGESCAWRQVSASG